MLRQDDMTGPADFSLKARSDGRLPPAWCCIYFGC